MADYIDLEELKGRVYFAQAALDDRFVFEEIQPDPSVAEVVNGVWMDGLQRFRLTDCAHLEAYRDGDLCTYCGRQNPYEPPKMTAARKAAAKKTTAPKKSK